MLGAPRQRNERNERTHAQSLVVFLHRFAVFVLLPRLDLVVSGGVQLAVRDEDVLDRLQQPPEAVEERQLPADDGATTAPNEGGLKLDGLCVW